MKALLDHYTKILSVDLKSGKFKAKRIPEDEKAIMPKTNNIYEYWSWFVHDSGLLHPNNVEEFSEFTKHPPAQGFYIYDRKVGNGWKTILMEITPSSKGVVLTTRDVSDIYTTEVDKIKSKDTMTNLLNRFAFERDIAYYKSGVVGVVFCDLNGLKYINDTIGHEEGDRLIIGFAELLKSNFADYKVYHISGDEFVVLAFNVKIRDFLQRVIAFHKYLWVNQKVPMASLGYSVDLSDIRGILEYAEEMMKEDKKIFYMKFPHYARK